MNYEQFYTQFVLTYVFSNKQYVPVLLSKIDSSYAGTKFEDLHWLFDKGIIHDIQNVDNEAHAPSNIGYNPHTGTWYGWVGQVIRGFKVGDSISESDIAYVPSNHTQFLDIIIQKYDDYNEEEGVKVTYASTDIGVEVTVGWMNKGFSKMHLYPDVWGNGTWKAKSTSDAKRMAQDFVRNLSSIANEL